MEIEELKKIGFNSDVSDILEYEFERGDIWLHLYEFDNFITLGIMDNGDIIYIELESYNTVKKVKQLINTISSHVGILNPKR